jgi:hypothetical protein
VTSDGGVLETSLNSNSAPLSALHLGLLTGHHHRFAATFLQVDQENKKAQAAKRKPLFNVDGKALA